MLLNCCQLSSWRARTRAVTLLLTCLLLAGSTGLDDEEAEAPVPVTASKPAAVVEDWDHGAYVRIGGGAESTARMLASSVHAGAGYRFGVVRLGGEYQGALLGTTQLHRFVANFELVLGTRVVEFFARVAFGYAAAGSTILASGVAGKAGLGIDFRLTRSVSIGVGGDFDLQVVFGTFVGVFPGGSGFARASFLL
jgi:hypothetical protein